MKNYQSMYLLNENKDIMIEKPFFFCFTIITELKAIEHKIIKNPLIYKFSINPLFVMIGILLLFLQFIFNLLFFT